MTSQPPPPPTAAPISRPSASSATAVPGPVLAACSAVAAPAMATSTSGVAIPSLRPLSTLISRRILAGTAGLTIMPAPRAASVGASAAPMSRASQMSLTPGRMNASSVPRPMASGRPMPSSRRHSPRSARNWCSPTRDASENSTSASVASARTFTTSLPGVIPSGASGPWVSSTPATVNTIGAVMSKRSSRADNVPHANTSPAMIARSATVIASPPTGCMTRSLISASATFPGQRYIRDPAEASPWPQLITARHLRLAQPRPRPRPRERLTQPYHPQARWQARTRTPRAGHTSVSCDIARTGARHDDSDSFASKTSQGQGI